MQENTRYEILDNMEIVVATAETWEDAIYAAQKYAPSLIYITETKLCRFIKTSEDVPV